jgi:hypothetical protein
MLNEEILSAVKLQINLGFTSGFELTQFILNQTPFAIQKN